MGYTRRHFLQRVKRVNEIYCKYQALGVSNENIYRLYIRDQFGIGRTAFYAYLTIPYRTELQKIDEAEERRKREEPTLFNEDYEN